MEVIILAGGFGTRLSQAVKDVPKPMAPIKGTPFLAYVLNYLSRFDVQKIILATGHKSEIIEKYFGNNYKGIDIIYSVEKKPLGTGGAMKEALRYCKNKNVVVLNGDTFFDVNLEKIMDFHRKENSRFTVAIKKMFNFSRYGTVEFEKNTILKFNEKKQTREGYINGGVYIIARTIFDDIKKEVFSIEKDYMEKSANKGKIKCFKSDGYFIDIGIPEDYYKANNELKYE